MHILKYDLGSDVEKVTIVPLGDIHKGSSHHAKKEFISTIEYIKNTPNVYTVLNGDLINNNIVGSVGDIFTEELNPQKQIDELIEILYPIREKILGVVAGNHEYRTYKNTGIDIGLYIAKELGIKKRYNPISNVIFISFGKQKNNNYKHTFSIYHTHLAGGGKSVGNRANKLKDLTNVINADVYIGSHLHTPMVFNTNYYLTYNNNKTVKECTRLFVMTCAYENYNNFAEKFSMTPSTIKQPKIILSYNKKGKYSKGVI